MQITKEDLKYNTIILRMLHRITYERTGKNINQLKKHRQKKEISRKKQDFVQQKMDLKSGVKSTPTVKCFPIFEKFSAILLQKIFIKSKIIKI